LLKARAIENQCYVIGVNRVGVDALELSYSGDSVVHTALGDEMAQLPANEEIHTTGLSLLDLRKVREKLPFLSDSNYRLFNR
jgi:predicted amidohydrolase